MKHGFMLVELIVATLIASMIGSLLLTALYQGSRSQTSIDTMFDTSLRVGIVSNILERDLIGAFVPVQARIKDAQEDEQDESAGEKSTKKPDAKKEAAGKKEDKEEKVSKPAEKPIEKIFYSTNKGERLDQLTFVTNNPLAVFVGKDVGVVKPKVVRVKYSLKPDDEASVDRQGGRAETFTLFRQEATELDLQKFGNVRAYEVISGIKNCTVNYTARIQKKQPASAKAAADVPAANKGKSAETKKAEKQPVVYEYKISKEWVSEQAQDQNKTAKKEDEQEPLRIPYFIEIKLVLWNKQYSKNEEFILSFELPVDTDHEQKDADEKDEKTEVKKASGNKKDEQSADKSSDKMVQANNDKNTLVDSLSMTLGNITKIFGKS